MQDRGAESDRTVFTMTPAPNPCRRGSRASGTRPLFRSRRLQIDPCHAPND